MKVKDLMRTNVVTLRSGDMLSVAEDIMSMGRIRHLRGNRLNNSQWHTRMTGEGVFAEQIASMFAVSCRRNRMCARPKLSCASFQRSMTQLGLFG